MEIALAGLQFSPIWPAELADYITSCRDGARPSAPPPELPRNPPPGGRRPVEGPPAGHPERMTGAPATAVEQQLWAQMEVNR